MQRPELSTGSQEDQQSRPGSSKAAASHLKRCEEKKMCEGEISWVTANGYRIKEADIMKHLYKRKKEHM